MAPDLVAKVQLGSQEHPVTWRAVAKDGADAPLATRDVAGRDSAYRVWRSLRFL